MEKNSGLSSKINNAPGTLANPLLAWYDEHGRKNLPWQKKPTAYRVWVSEIMLQQTQVSTVIPYFNRFIARFPHIHSLAKSPLDEVLHYWTGLGYYARARHLHQCAQEVVENHQGQLPTTLETLQSLPGIGRSTAGAILALSQGKRHPILDGNVRRVLSRWAAVAGAPTHKDTLNQLWHLADQETPHHRVGDYTQAIMDLGATCCTRHQPQCPTCPLCTQCRAYQQGTPTAYPHPKPKKTLPTRKTVLLIITHKKQAVYLEQRPLHGLWGGLWSFPELTFPTKMPPASPVLKQMTQQATDWCKKKGFHWTLRDGQIKEKYRHSFTHFHLEMTPLVFSIDTESLKNTPFSSKNWYNLVEPDKRGLPAPIKQQLAQLSETTSYEFT